MGKTDVKVLVQKSRHRQKFSDKKARQSAHNKETGKYIRQRMRTGRNKGRKLARHIKNHPNDLCAIKKQQNVKN